MVGKISKRIKIKAAEVSKVICPRRGKERASKAREAVAIARMIRRFNSVKRWSRANPLKGLFRIKAKKTISRKALKEKELSRIQTSLIETKTMRRQVKPRATPRSPVAGASHPRKFLEGLRPQNGLTRAASKGKKESRARAM